MMIGTESGKLHKPLNSNSAGARARPGIAPHGAFALKIPFHSAACCQPAPTDDCRHARFRPRRRVPLAANRPGSTLWPSTRLLKSNRNTAIMQRRLANCNQPAVRSRGRKTGEDEERRRSDSASLLVNIMQLHCAIGYLVLSGI